MEVKLLDRVRAAIRMRQDSRRTEQAYSAWIRRFIVFRGKHPRYEEIEYFAVVDRPANNRLRPTAAAAMLSRRG